MKKNLSFFAMMLFSSMLLAQTVTLTYTGRDANNNYHQLNRVIVTNLTKSWQETIYWPDTTLTMQVETGIDNYISGSKFDFLSQNSPNPFNGTTETSLTLAESGDILIQITDISGRLIAENEFSLQAGSHNFHIRIANTGIYFLTARQNGSTSTIKMVNNGGGAVNIVEYAGTETMTQNASQTASQAKGDAKGSTTKPFSFGDQMEYVGYATFNGTEVESQHIQQIQYSSQTFTVQFDEVEQTLVGLCPNAATVTDYDGNVYNTILIGQQCWMRENLKTTHYANGSSISLGDSSSTTIAYRYYPYNISGDVGEYGYLYNWKAVMGNSSSSTSNPSGVQGICPTGWHLPSDSEWTQLTDYVGSQSLYVCDSNDHYIARALASTTGWDYFNGTCNIGNNTNYNNATGFSAVPAGFYSDRHAALGVGVIASFWCSTEEYSNGNVYGRHLYNYSPSVIRVMRNKLQGFSVRCIKD